MEGAEGCVTTCKKKSCRKCQEYDMILEVAGQPVTRWEKYHEVFRTAADLDRGAAIPAVHDRMAAAGVFSKELTQGESFGIQAPEGFIANPLGSDGNNLYFKHLMDAIDYNAVMDINGKVITL